MKLRPADERKWRELGREMLATLQALVQILDAIKMKINSIGAERNASKEEEKPEPSERISGVGFCISQFPVAITEYYESQNTKSKSKLRRWWRRAKGVAEIIGIIAVVWYACITNKQWKTMTDTLTESRKQTEIAQQQLESTTRAWMSAEVTINGPSHFREGWDAHQMRH